jgi:cobalamin biosynthesis Mg chelatase CobN
MPSFIAIQITMGDTLQTENIQFKRKQPRRNTPAVHWISTFTWIRQSKHSDLQTNMWKWYVTFLQRLHTHTSWTREKTRRYSNHTIVILIYQLHIIYKHNRRIHTNIKTLSYYLYIHVLYATFYTDAVQFYNFQTFNTFFEKLLTVRQKLMQFAYIFSNILEYIYDYIFIHLLMINHYRKT